MFLMHHFINKTKQQYLYQGSVLPEPAPNKKGVNLCIKKSPQRLPEFKTSFYLAFKNDK